jgi:glycerophosphoryl diester phosphodiesterase
VQARRLYAHRGASAERPENTLTAFERAVELGVDGLEMDVHLTRDGHLIVVHDDTARRTTAVAAPWAALDLADVRRLDAGWGFVAPDGTRPFAGRGIGVPTLEEVIDAFPRVRLNVDIKRGAAAAVAAIDLVRRMKAEDRVTIASFHLGTLVALRRRGYGGETSLSRGEIASLLSMPALLWRQLPFTGTAAQVPLGQGAIRFDRAPFIAKCHSLGLRVDFWTVDDAATAERLLGLGADGIMTNDPAAIRPLFQLAPSAPSA